MTIISKEQVYPRINEVFQNSESNTVTTNQLKTWLANSFGANENQVSGLIHRMHSKDHILEKVEGFRGVYRLSIVTNQQENISEFMKNEIHLVIKKIEEKVSLSLIRISSKEFIDIQQTLIELSKIREQLESE